MHATSHISGQDTYQMMNQVIAFDADDTLWVNEPLFREAEKEFSGLMRDFLEREECAKKLYECVTNNLPLYGYGIKSFALSLTEIAIQISDGKVPNEILVRVINIGKEMLNAPVVVLDGVKEILDTLTALKRPHDKLIVATKGDLLDQERKFEKSGLAGYFDHIEVMSDKQPANYRKLITKLGVQPKDFTMIGNSVKSDILPVLEIGGRAFHIPYHTTWQHEVVKEPVVHPNFKELKSILTLEKYL